MIQKDSKAPVVASVGSSGAATALEELPRRDLQRSVRMKCSPSMKSPGNEQGTTGMM